jgi:peroxiredoxin Q/BCP
MNPKLKVGEPAPDVWLTTDEGERVELRALRGQEVIVFFYVKDDTPGCAQQVCAFRDLWPTWEERGARVLGVGVGTAAGHQKFRKKHGLPFALVVDEDHAVAEAFGVWREKVLYGRRSMGVVRSIFVIGADGALEQVHDNVRAGRELGDLLGPML